MKALIHLTHSCLLDIRTWNSWEAQIYKLLLQKYHHWICLAPHLVSTNEPPQLEHESYHTTKLLALTHKQTVHPGIPHAQGFLHSLCGAAWLQQMGSLSSQEVFVHIRVPSEFCSRQRELELRHVLEQWLNCVGFGLGPKPMPMETFGLMISQWHWTCTNPLLRKVDMMCDVDVWHIWILISSLPYEILVKDH